MLALPSLHHLSYSNKRFQGSCIKFRSYNGHLQQYFFQGIAHIYQYHNHIVYFAGIVQRFKHLGARVVGKNNMHELSFGVTSANHSYGAVITPANERHSAGGAAAE